MDSEDESGENIFEAANIYAVIIKWTQKEISKLLKTFESPQININFNVLTVQKREANADFEKLKPR